jgi:hypothetical protein
MRSTVPGAGALSAANAGTQSTLASIPSTITIAKIIFMDQIPFRF